MTEDAAIARLAQMTAATTEPQLSTSPDGDIEQLLEMHVITAPSAEGADDGVWAMNRAAAEGWRWKAGRAIDSNLFLTDARGNARDLQHKGALEMARFYDERADALGEPFDDVKTMELIEMEVGANA